MEKDAKEAFELPATRGSKKHSDRAVTPAMRAACVPATWRCQGLATSQAAAPPSCSTLTRAELPQAKERLVSTCTGSLWSCLTLCNLVDCGLPGFSVQGRGFPRQEYQGVLANTACHTLLAHYISCCPSR